MQDWETKQANDISEIILAAHIVSLLIFMMIIFSFIGRTTERQAFYPASLIIIILFAIFGLGIVVYIARRLLIRFAALERPKIDEILLLAVMLPVTFTFIWYSKDFGGKMLLVIPAIITAIAFGRLAGVGEALLSGGLLFLLDYLLYLHPPSNIFQTDLNITAVTALLAWLVGSLIEVERRTQRELLKLADYDPLTGLTNYRFLHDRLATSLRQAVAAQYPLSLALLDIDQLSYYNQVYGYQEGDEILKMIGGMLQEEVREPCYTGRYGNDSFMLVLPGQNKQSARIAAGEIAANLAGKVNSALRDNGGSFWKEFHVSTGTSCYPEHGDAVLPLIQAAKDDLRRARYSKADYMYQSVVSQISTLSLRNAFPTLRAFLTLINVRDQYTYSHSERVLAYSLALGERIGLAEPEMDLLRFSAYLHDIGKLEIDASLLNKAESLNQEEQAIVRSHSVRGSDLLKPLVAYLPLIPIIRAHHENYDGSGYPDGLREEDIPILARIIRIADSFDVMTVGRSYRRARTMDDTCAELQARAGSWYDPQLVFPFLEIMKEIYQPLAK
jgi:diguanylate cyclase (GGDEF)-like protein/putative nucleotidyltransferase with HDIG domain